MLPFFNREQERGRMESWFEGGDGSFLCLYGRRRLGKSRLLQEVLPKGKSVYYVADEREASLQREELAISIAAYLPGFADVVYPDWLSLLKRWWDAAPEGSVLALDEFPYLVQLSPELPSVVQKLIDQYRKKPCHLVICGSSQRMMQGLVLDGNAPLYGRAQEILPLKPLAPFWLRKAFSNASPMEYLKAYAVWGGVPRYWELASPYRATDTAMESLILNPLGVLHQEPERLLLDDLRDVAQAASILSLIGRGCQRLSNIASRLEKPSTSLTRPIARLLDLGLIERQHPFGITHSKTSLYRVADPFLGFWFRFIEPNRSLLQSGQVPLVKAKIKAEMPSYLGHVFEALARDSFSYLTLKKKMWLPAQRWWGKGEDKRDIEVDVVAETEDAKELAVAEVKLSLTQKQLERVVYQLEEKIAALPFAKSYQKIYPVVFVADKKGLKSRDVTLLDMNDLLKIKEAF